MDKTLSVLITALLFAASAFPQAGPRKVPRQPGVWVDNGTKLTYPNRNVVVSGSFGIPVKTVATLPAASANTGNTFDISDSADGTCTTGSGTIRVRCYSTGSAWVATSVGLDSSGNAKVPGALTVGTTLPSTAPANSFGVGGNFWSSDIFSDYAGGVAVGDARGGALAMFSSAVESGIIANWAYGSLTDTFARNGAAPQILLAIGTDVTAGTSPGDILFLTTASGVAGTHIVWSPLAQFRQSGNHTFAGTLSISATLGVLPIAGELLHVDGSALFSGSGQTEIAINSTTNTAAITFQHAGVEKWAFGRLGSADTFSIYSDDLGGPALTMTFNTSEVDSNFAGTVRSTGFNVNGSAGTTKTCSAMPTAITIVGGIITSVTGGTCI